MKKFLLLLGVILFTGCGSNVMTCSYKSNENGNSINLSYKVKYKGSKVTSIKSTEKVTSDDSSVISSYKQDVETFYEPLKNIDNYIYSVKYNEKSLTVTTSINYSKIDLDEMLLIDPNIEYFMKDGHIDINLMKSSYESLGLTCKK